METTERKIQLVALNPCITCKICSGYLIDATTVSECLHTFCKSCLVKHLEENNTCPECKLVIHQSHPLQYIAFDRTMQDIVYKVVPKLQENEFRRQLDFYRSRGQSCPKSLLMVSGNTLLTEQDLMANEQRKLNEAEYTRRMEQINLSITPKIPAGPRRLDPVQKKFIRCSAMTTIGHLQKYIALKLFNNSDLYKQIEVSCNDQALQSERSLKYVYISKWRFQDPPLALTYQRALPTFVKP